jgi:6-phosphofructokinase 1
MDTLKAFASHSSHDSEYVLQVSAFLKRHMTVFAYEEHQRAGSFQRQIDSEMEAADAFVVFVGRTVESSHFLLEEIETARAWRKSRKTSLQFIPVVLNAEAADTGTARSLASLNAIVAYTYGERIPPAACAKKIVERLVWESRPLVWNAQDDLPTNPHLFSYEKDIIHFFTAVLERGADLYQKADNQAEERLRQKYRRKIADGCPVQWPEVVNLARTPDVQLYPNRLCQDDRDPAMVAAAALDTYLPHGRHIVLPEARPSRSILFPIAGHGPLRVAIVVMGGIAPGINAVIDGIVQRHWNYQRTHSQTLTIHGYKNGLHGILHAEPPYSLVPDKFHPWQMNAEMTLSTSEHANRGGSILGTSRLESLLPEEGLANEEMRLNRLTSIVQFLNGQHVDILYMIGGDGTMRAAHALRSIAVQMRGDRKLPLSIVGVPKTMDNDILWVWQSFGFMSAVEKSREFIQHLQTEVASNPRLCVLQLFGSDSGFVVSHAVLASSAGHCDVALIPEVEFSLLGLAARLEQAMKDREHHIPSGMVVMAETAIPVDARWYLDDIDLPIGLPESARGDVNAVRGALELGQSERAAILKFDDLRLADRRIQGQTDDVLRRAGMRLVMQGLEAILHRRGTYRNVRFDELRMLRNEPRHLVRAIPPSTSDIIMGQRLGTLAVDNAMAGYTDFMISQWLTEYVLVPLKLVVLGRKRIPEQGIFWQSVLAKTGQPADLVSPWPQNWKTLTSESVMHL